MSAKRSFLAELKRRNVSRAGASHAAGAELINAAGGSTLWSRHYDRAYTDLFAMQDEITQAAAIALRAQLQGRDTATQSDHPPNGNLAAYTAYLRGKFHSSCKPEADARRAIAQYTTAIQLDPRCARAYVGRSGAWTNLATLFPDSAAAAQVRRICGAGF